MMIETASARTEEKKKCRVRKGIGHCLKLVQIQMVREWHGVAGNGWLFLIYAGYDCLNHPVQFFYVFLSCYPGIRMSLCTNILFPYCTAAELTVLPVL